MSTNETVLRQITMLRLIPRHPRKIDASSIKQRLHDAGYDIDIRTIQRDLNKLSQAIPIVTDNARPQGWSWQANAASLELAALDAPSALTLKMVEQYLTPLLPRSVLEHLRPWFDTATGVLNTSSQGLGQWSEKVRVIPNAQLQRPPAISPEIQSTIYQALLEEQRVALQYQRRGAARPQQYVVSPLALVVRDNLIYLICTFWDYPEIMQLVLHRAHGATLLDEPVARPDGFDIDQYIAAGNLGLPVTGSPIRLEAEFTMRVAGLLQERPLSADQTVTPIDDLRSLVCASVYDTKELRWWLQGFGSEVRIIAPDPLREEFRRTAQELMQLYA
jgi:predicted DNA-binding transcriptional regulator YafY